MSTNPTPNLPLLPIPYDVKQGHARYLASEFNIDAATGGPVDPSSNTNKGHQLDGTNNLHEAAARLVDGGELLRSSLQVLNDPDASKTAKIAATRTMNKLASLMTAAADVSSDAARVVSPLPGTKPAHQRLQTMRAKEVRKANKKAGRKSATIDPRVAMIDEFVGREGSPAASKSPPKSASAKRKRLPTRAKRRDDAIPDPPAPSNGKDEYGVGEFLRIRSLVDPKKRRKVVLKMMKKGYVPVTESSLYRLYAAVDRGERIALDEPWREGAGRPAKIHNSKLKEITERLSTCQGAKEMKTKVNEILVEEERKKGHIVEAGKMMSSTTVNTYTALLASYSDKLTITDCSIAKSNNRFTVENSLIEAVCYTVVVAMTHFYVAETEDVEWRETLATIPKEDRLLYDLVCAFHDGKPVRPRPSWAILSSDDTGEVATVGLQPDNSRKVGLVAKSALANSGTKSLYHVERSTKMNYRRCKRHFISNAKGDSAPAVWIFKCSASEMPVESEDFIVWEVPSLCVGGYGVGGSKAPGYVIFYRDNVKGQEKRRFRWLREHILFPWISRIRKSHGFDDSTGAHIPEAFKFVSWCDGDNSQLFTITEEEAIQAYVDHGGDVLQARGERVRCSARRRFERQFHIVQEFQQKEHDCARTVGGARSQEGARAPVQGREGERSSLLRQATQRRRLPREAAGQPHDLLSAEDDNQGVHGKWSVGPDEANHADVFRVHWNVQDASKGSPVRAHHSNLHDVVGLLLQQRDAVHRRRVPHLARTSCERRYGGQAAD